MLHFASNRRHGTELLYRNIDFLFATPIDHFYTGLVMCVCAFCSGAQLQQIANSCQCAECNVPANQLAGYVL